MDEIAILLPCYNESGTIAKVVRDFRELFPTGGGATVYVYDNNSTDGTDRLAREAGAVVRYERQQGKGNVIRRMFREIDAKCYIMADGDDTYPAESAVAMAEAVLKRGADMVVGDRLSSTYFQENKRPFHNLGNNLVRRLINRLFRNDIKDIMTGYRAFSYQFVKTFPVLSKGFEIETEMTIHAVDKNMRVENQVIEYRDRPDGSVSKLNTYSDGLRVIKTIFRLYKNHKPFPFFTFISIFLALVSCAMFIPILVHYCRTGLVPNFPTLIVSGFIAMAALLTFSCGLILTTIIEKDRQRFEMRLIDVDGRYRDKLKKERLCDATVEQAPSPLPSGGCGHEK